jgi:hypothetical protein
MTSARLVAMVVFLGLSSCVYPVPEPVPYPDYVAPVPPPPIAYRRCAPGWHWVRGHYNQWGAWIRGHCLRNWVNPPATGRDQPPHRPPSPPDAPSAANPKVAPE